MVPIELAAALAALRGTPPFERAGVVHLPDPQRELSIFGGAR